MDIEEEAIEIAKTILSTEEPEFEYDGIEVTQKGNSPVFSVHFYKRTDHGKNYRTVQVEVS